MARKLTNRSRSIQMLKTSTPGRIGGLYSSSITIKPGQVVTVSDADFAAMHIDLASIQVTFVDDALVDTVQEVNDLIAGAGPSGISALTGDVTASGTGSVAAAVALVGGKTAAAVATSVNATLAATDAATASTIMKRDASANVSVNFLSAGTVYAPFQTAINLATGGVFDSVGADSENFQTRRLFAANSSLSADWANRVLSNGVTGNVLDWGNSLLYDNAGGNSISWQSRQMMVSAGGTSLNWESFLLYDSLVNISANWSARNLYAADGTTVVANWTKGLKSQTGATGSRPALAAGDAGVQYFDTTLALPIWWSGAGWIKADGTAA